VQLQLPYTPHPDLKSALLPRWVLAQYCPVSPPPCQHPGSDQDPLVAKYPVLEIYFCQFHPNDGDTVRGTSMQFQEIVFPKANPKCVRTDKSQLAKYSKLSCFPLASLHISTHADTFTCCLAHGAVAPANVKSLASIESSGQQASQPPSMQTQPNV